MMPTQTLAKQERTKSIVEQQSEFKDHSDAPPIDMVIASLVDQLKKENENIAQLMERQRQLRLELLKAQEESLAALRRNESKD